MTQSSQSFCGQGQPTVGKAWLRYGWTGLQGAMDVRKKTTVDSLRPVGYLKGSGGLRESGTGVHGAPGHSGHLPGVMGNRRTQSRKGTWSGTALECHPRHEEGEAAWTISGVCSTGPCAWAKWTGFSTLVGSDPCPLSLQRGLRAPLVSQSSGSHCAPVMVQGNQYRAGAHPRAPGTCGRRSSKTRA